MMKRRTSKVRQRPEVRVLRAQVMSPRIFWHDFCRAWGIVLKMILVLVLLGGLGWGLWKGTQRGLIHNKEFALKHTVINDNPVVDRERFFALSGIGKQATLFQCDPGTLEAALTALPEVARASVRREFPHTLAVEVEPRRPVAWVAKVGDDGRDREHGMLVDANDVLFPCTAELYEHAVDLPVIRLRPTIQAWPDPGEVVEHPDYFRGMRLYRVAREHDAGAHQWIDTIRQHRPWGSLLTTRGGVQATFGHRDPARQMGDLLTALAHAHEYDAKIATIKLVGKRNLPVTYDEPPPPKAILIEPPPTENPKNADLERLLER